MTIVQEGFSPFNDMKWRIDSFVINIMKMAIIQDGFSPFNDIKWRIMTVKNDYVDIF